MPTPHEFKCQELHWICLEADIWGPGLSLISLLCTDAGNRSSIFLGSFHYFDRCLHTEYASSVEKVVAQAPEGVSEEQALIRAQECVDTIAVDFHELRERLSKRYPMKECV